MPAVAYFWLIEHYGVNVIFWDQADDMKYVGASYSGNLSFGVLWQQHEAHRMLFPNLIVLLLAHTTHLNILFEEYVSGIMLCVATGLLILAHKRRSPSKPWIYYFPVAVLMFSLAQFQNTLWGFQLAWFLVLLALSVSLFLLDRPALTRLAFAGAIVAAVIGSCSSLQGLLIWPAGLLLLFLRRRSTRVLLAWVTAAVVTGAVYLYHLKASAGYSTPSYVFMHPLVSIKYFLFLIGGVIGVSVDGSGWPTIGSLQIGTTVGVLLGVLRLLVVAWIVIAYGRRRGNEGGGPIGVTLICFGLLFSLMTTDGRASPELAIPSRFTTYNLLVLVGCYLVLFDRPLRGPRVTRFDRVTTISLPIVRIALLAAICIQVVVGTAEGIEGARMWHQDQIFAADVTANIGKASPALVNKVLRPDGTTRQWDLIARTDDLSLYATNEAASYRRLGLFPELALPQTRVSFPSNDATVSHTVPLVASASDLTTNISKVEFVATGGTLHGSVISPTAGTTFGWLGFWNTTMVANGMYSLQCVAYSTDGKTSISPAVVVRVDNS